MKLNELRDTSYEIAKSKGWHDEDLKRSFADLMALAISELVEALEEHRAGHPANELRFPDLLVRYPASEVHDADLAALAADGYKPEGVIVELADAAIRIGDAAACHGITLIERPCLGEYGLLPDVRDNCHSYKLDWHSFGDWMCAAAGSLAKAAREDRLGGEVSLWLTDAVMHLCGLVHWLGITGEEFERAIEIKHAFNRTRPHRHGGKLL